MEAIKPLKGISGILLRFFHQVDESDVYIEISCAGDTENMFTTMVLQVIVKIIVNVVLNTSDPFSPSHPAPATQALLTSLIRFWHTVRVYADSRYVTFFLKIRHRKVEKVIRTMFQRFLCIRIFKIFIHISH